MRSLQVFRRIALVTFALTFAAQARAQTDPAGPDLKAFSQSGLIPFAPGPRGQPSFEAPPKVSLRLDGPLGRLPTRPVVMDTGSTGLVVSAADLPDYSAAKTAGYTPGWEFLSSSKRLWVGHWVPTTVTFFDANGDEAARAQVPVLVVEAAMRCPGYDVKASPGTCVEPVDKVDLPKGIAYLGVGFGREGNGQTQGTPDKNALLNLTALAGRPITPSAYRRGYLITHEGVRVGLTASAVAGFRVVKLDAGAGPMAWRQAPMQVAVGDQPAQAGALLIDTGIAHMYLGVAHPEALQTALETNPSTQKPAKVLAPGQTVTVTVPTRPATTFAFTMGENDAAAPDQVLVNSPTAKGFVNTGRHMLRRYDVMFDADGGWFGLRPS